MKAVWNGVVIAETDDTVIVERNHYFPADAVDTRYLIKSDKTSFCPWKGTANYYSLVVNGQSNPDAAWYYANPKPEAGEIKDRIAFWRGVKISQ